MRKSIGIVVFLLLILQNYAAAGSSTDLNITRMNTTGVEIRWQAPEYTLEKSGIYTRMILPECNYSDNSGKPDVPFKRFLLAVPDGARIAATIRVNKTEQLDNILLVPVPTPTRDKNGTESTIFLADSESYNFSPENSIQISHIYYYRDTPVVQVIFYPVTYNHGERKLTLIQNADLLFRFTGTFQQNRPRTGRRSLRERLGYDHILNSEQAQSWQTEKPSFLSKRQSLADGPWFKFSVNEDGIYRIDYSTLRDAGIDVDNLDPRTIKIYNNGGRPLNTDAMAEENNPDGPVENAIFVEGEQDNSFDEGDYILCFGKKLGGWYYNNSQQQFTFVMHPYDVINYYWLTYGGTMGKRMPAETTSNLTALRQVSHFTERVHFEEELENLLASGTDWYGRRMSGLSDQLNLEYSLDNVEQSPDEALMRIKFKGGSGVKYDDIKSPGYQYRFTVYVNSDKTSTPLINREQLFSYSSKIIPVNFPANAVLNSGTNKVSISYSGNYEECNAYLDWIEFYYPRPMTATDNQLIFYTEASEEILEYHLTGFSANLLYLFDITDPVNVKKLSVPQPDQTGNVVFKLNDTDNKAHHYIITNPENNTVKRITGLQRYEPQTNLLSITAGSDLIVITHPSFVPYAQEIVDLRQAEDASFSGRVVSVDDIFFYFSSGVRDPVAIRNFLRHAYYNWSNPVPSYVLLFGDGHYDYRHIVHPDSNYVPVYQISADGEIYSRECDSFFADVNFRNEWEMLIVPDLAIGRLPVNSRSDARNVVDKLKAYSQGRSHDGWQSILTFVADDQNSGLKSSSEWGHFSDTETLARLGELNKFIKEKIYLATYPGVPGTFGTIKPAATRAIIDQLNEGTLIINYVGHGSNTGWAHESAISMGRDLDLIQNKGKESLWIAATCTFGKFDDPAKPGFSEALLNKEDGGAIAIVAATRAVFSEDNFFFNVNFLSNLFPNGQPSERIGNAFTKAVAAGSVNYQKFHLLGDPSMLLADPHQKVHASSIKPDTLKALSRITIEGEVLKPGTNEVWNDYSGGAMLIVNDARIDSIDAGDNHYFQDIGARLFKGEVSLEKGRFKSEFIVPKSIRYKKVHSGRATLLSWNEEGGEEAIGYVDTLLFYGTVSGLEDDEGPDIELYFEGQTGFNTGDMVSSKPVLIAELFDDQGINLTREVGHAIEIRVDNQTTLDITNFFSYDKNSYTKGKLIYHLDNLEIGDHNLQLKVWDNLNNPSEEEIEFRIPQSAGLVLGDVFNYPNPFTNETDFTFQAQGVEGIASVKIKIYTISGRLIRTLDNELSPPRAGFNYYHWDGRDNDGDRLANGVYLYKVILKNNDEQKEAISKLVILK